VLISDVSAGGAVQVKRSADLALASVVFAEIWKLGRPPESLFLVVLWVV
jgi:hypothetical protein